MCDLGVSSEGEGRTSLLFTWHCAPNYWYFASSCAQSRSCQLELTVFIVTGILCFGRFMCLIKYFCLILKKYGLTKYQFWLNNHLVNLEWGYVALWCSVIPMTHGFFFIILFLHQVKRCLREGCLVVKELAPRIYFTFLRSFLNWVVKILFKQSGLCWNYGCYGWYLITVGTMQLQNMF